MYMLVTNNTFKDVAELRVESGTITLAFNEFLNYLCRTKDMLPGY